MVLTITTTTTTAQAFASVGKRNATTMGNSRRIGSCGPIGNVKMALGMVYVIIDTARNDEAIELNVDESFGYACHQSNTRVGERAPHRLKSIVTIFETNQTQTEPHQTLPERAFVVQVCLSVRSLAKRHV